MVKSQEKNMNTFISWLFMLYFVILFVERFQSIIRSYMDSNVLLYGNAFNGYTYTITFLSLGATIILLLFFNGSFWQSLINYSITPNYSMLTITAGVLLISGMVHTEHTIAPIQFVSYGMLIIAMVLRTIQVSSGAEFPFGFWYSLIFLTAFSMAIPVMYHSNIEQATLFHIIEAIASIVLVFFFTCMLRQMFIGQGSNLLYWIPIIVAIVFDAIIIAMRWKESVNSFVLIFIIASTIIFTVGKIIFAILK